VNKLSVHLAVTFEYILIYNKGYSKHEAQQDSMANDQNKISSVEARLVFELK